MRDELVQLNIVCALYDKSHASAMIEVDILHENGFATVHCESGIGTLGCAEDHHIAHGSGNVLLEDAVDAVLALLGLQSGSPQPIVVNVIGVRVG